MAVLSFEEILLTCKYVDSSRWVKQYGDICSLYKNNNIDGYSNNRFLSEIKNFRLRAFLYSYYHDFFPFIDWVTDDGIVGSFGRMCRKLKKDVDYLCGRWYTIAEIERLVNRSYKIIYDNNEAAYNFSSIVKKIEELEYNPKVSRLFMVEVLINNAIYNKNNSNFDAALSFLSQAESKLLAIDSNSVGVEFSSNEYISRLLFNIYLERSSVRTLTDEFKLALKNIDDGVEIVSNRLSNLDIYNVKADIQRSFIMYSSNRFSIGGLYAGNAINKLNSMKLVGSIYHADAYFFLGLSQEKESSFMESTKSYSQAYDGYINQLGYSPLAFYTDDKRISNSAEYSASQVELGQCSTVVVTNQLAGLEDIDIQIRYLTNHDGGSFLRSISERLPVKFNFLNGLIYSGKTALRKIESDSVFYHWTGLKISMDKRFVDIARMLAAKRLIKPLQCDSTQAGPAL